MAQQDSKKQELTGSFKTKGDVGASAGTGAFSFLLKGSD